MTETEPGRCVMLQDGLRRVLAPNPGPMTRWGTNTFILGEGRVAIVDPGPDDPAHLAALRAATAGETVTHILVTHAHSDHSALARRLSRMTGAKVHAFGRPDAGRSPGMTELAEAGLSGGGEGVDARFEPDIELRHGDRIAMDGGIIDVLHTPGHFSGHLAFAFGEALVSGDHVMDWSSSLVSPPDGDLGAFMRTSGWLRDAGFRTFHPGHGNAIEDPSERLGWLIAHRRTREAAILNALGPEPRAIADLAPRVYRDVPDAMLPAAERNLFAHLIDLHERNMIRAIPRLALDAGYALA